jgi:hypothetical protein
MVKSPKEKFGILYWPDVIVCFFRNRWNAIVAHKQDQEIATAIYLAEQRELVEISTVHDAVWFNDYLSGFTLQI